MIEDLSSYELHLVHRAVEGEEIRDARLHHVFKMLFTKFKNDAIKARNDLVAVDPHNAQTIIELQHDVRRYEESAEMIRSAIIDGREAFEQLQLHRGERSAEPEQD